LASGITLQGERELLAALKRLGETLTRQSAIEAALLDGAEPIRAQAEANAPRDKGQLAGSVTKAAKRGGGLPEVAVGPDNSGFYGVFAEHGTSKQARKPWLRPAFDERKDEATRRVKERLASEVQGVTGGA
jgi:HK97 gp10 family phage protein